MTNNIRKQYLKLNIPLIKDIEKVISCKKDDYDDTTYKDIRDYPVCIVGTVRERLGLSPKYEIQCYYDEIENKSKENDQYCSKCKELANDFPYPVEGYTDLKDCLTGTLNWSDKWRFERDLKEQKEKYEALLIELKQHLVLDHKKRIDQ